MTNCGDDSDDTQVEEPESCSDGIKNNDETEIDCGGSCEECFGGIFADDFQREDTENGNIGPSWTFASLDVATNVFIQGHQVRISQNAAGVDLTIAVVEGLDVTEENFSVYIDKANFPDNQESSMGVIGRVNPAEGTAYGMTLEDDKLKLIKFVGDGVEELQTLRFTWDTKSTYKLELKFEGSTISGMVYDNTGRLIDTVTDTDSDYSSGTIGFIARSGVDSSIQFDEFVAE